jgi:hypothetical protein
MHPTVSLMARRRGLVRARKIGIAAGLDASGAIVASKDVGGNGDGRSKTEVDKVVT